MDQLLLLTQVFGRIYFDKETCSVRVCYVKDVLRITKLVPFNTLPMAAGSPFASSAHPAFASLSRLRPAHTNFFPNLIVGASPHREERASSSLNKPAETSALHAPLFAMNSESPLATFRSPARFPLTAESCLCSN
jgi:hypothetical protein